MPAAVNGVQSISTRRILINKRVVIIGGGLLAIALIVGFGLVNTSTNASLAPDLIIKYMYLEMAGRQGNCVEAYSRYEIRVVVENIGSVNATAFVVDMNSTRKEVKQGLEAGQQITLHFAGTTPSGRYDATADSMNQVVESDEDNNTLSFLAPTPTPPLLCTPTPTSTP